MTSIVISYKRRKIAQVSLSYDEPNPTSLSMGVLKVKVSKAEDELLANFAYYLTSFPAGKIFILLENLDSESTNKQRISYEELVTILRSFPEEWTYQATDIPRITKSDDGKDELYEQTGVMIY